MRLIEKEIFIKKSLDINHSILEYLTSRVLSTLPANEIPIRFLVSNTNDAGYLCELGILDTQEHESKDTLSSIFKFNKRIFENTKDFNAVLLIPTGIGAEIGGHCGDGNVIARLIASACDTLITHPNVVNASDINEMTENTLYVEGSIISRLLMGQIGLQKTRSNRILMLMDKHDDPLFNDEIINAVSSARISLGIDCDVYEMPNIINSESMYSNSGRATGKIENLEYLFDIIQNLSNDYEAIGLSTFIKVPEYYHKNYFSNDDMINPWGGIEAMLTHSVSTRFNLPSAHSPMMASREVMELEVGIVDPRKAPESASLTYLHCILKGLHKSPRITHPNKGINSEDISCLIIPYGCIGLPTLAALEQGIPVIAVKENKNQMGNKLEEFSFKHNKLFVVENYLEAIGIMHAIKSGISIDTIQRPIAYTRVLESSNFVINKLNNI